MKDQGFKSLFEYNSNTGFYKKILATVILIFAASLSDLNASEDSASKRIKKEGRVFFHKIHNGKKSDPDIEIFVDGAKIDDLNKLDSSGLPLSEGPHNLRLRGLKFKPILDEFKYDIKGNQELHFFYCEEDGSFHNYTNFIDEEKQIKFDSPGLNFHEYAQSTNKRKAALKKICRPSKK